LAYNRLLIIDDEPEIATTLGKMGRRSGFDTIVTTDGVDFLERLRAWDPTVLMLDLQMAEMNGRAILGELIKRSCKARILIVSGHDVEALQQAKEFGLAGGLHIADTLQKPLRFDILRAALKAIFDDAEMISVPNIKDGIRLNEFYLEYQPKIDLRGRRVAGVEALARWRHPARGLIPPDRFIPFMEASGCIDEFTRFVIDAAAAQAKLWRADGTDLDIAVNISGGSAGSPDFVDVVRDICADHQIDPGFLTVEITETAAMGDVKRAVNFAQKLRNMGVTLSIDDFGTGYSSLLQLLRLPFTEVKIDRSFVMDCGESLESRVIVTTIIGLAHNLGLRVVAEGVETGAIADYLTKLGCDEAQGYHFARSMPGERIPLWVNQWSARASGPESEG